MIRREIRSYNTDEAYAHTRDWMRYIEEHGTIPNQPVTNDWEALENIMSQRSPEIQLTENREGTSTIQDAVNPDISQYVVSTHRDEDNNTWTSEEQPFENATISNTMSHMNAYIDRMIAQRTQEYATIFTNDPFKGKRLPKTVKQLNRYYNDFDNSRRS